MISGFNDNIAWGVTNAGRDVRDWYQIVFKDSKQDEYLLDEHWMPVKKRIEKFVLKGGRVLYDTVCYTHQGPVVYDKNFNQKLLNYFNKNLIIFAFDDNSIKIKKESIIPFSSRKVLYE